MRRTRKSRDDPIKKRPSASGRRKSARTPKGSIAYAPDLSRIRQRQNPEQWGMDELLTLPEAVALHPFGPYTVTLLRTAIRRSELAVAVIAGKHFTSRRHLADMTTCRKRNPPGAEDVPEVALSTGSTTMVEARRKMEAELSALACPRNPQGRLR